MLDWFCRSALVLRLAVPLALVTLGPAAPRPATGALLWTPGGVPVTVAPGEQGVARTGPPGIAIVADGAGGAFIAWEDNASGNVFAQRLDGNGQPLWPLNGSPVAPGSWFQFSPRLVADGSGGVIVAWVDGRNGFCTLEFQGECDIFAQRLDGTGHPVWPAAGVPVVTAERNQGLSGIGIVGDGAGGAVLAWEDARPPDCCRIFAQRLTADGQVAWTPDGVPVSPPPSIVIGPIGAPPIVIADGAGGALIAWLNNQVNPVTTPAPPIAVQHLDAFGQPLWPTNGVWAGFAARGEFDAVSDGTGGVIVAWAGPGASGYTDILAQRVSDTGAVLWQSGVPVSQAAYFQYNPQVASDGAGGVIVVWDDLRSDQGDIFAQRVDAGGQVLWPVDGIAIAAVPGPQFSPRIVPDGSGGAIIAWQDCRDYAWRDPCLTGMDLYAQRVSASGQPIWTPGGTPVSTAAGNQGIDYGSNLTSSAVMVADGAGGAIGAWPDGRNGFCEFAAFLTDCDIYAQRISGEPIAGEPDVHVVQPALDFGNVRIGNLSGLQMLTVENRGSEPLTLGTIVRGGADPGQFRTPALADLCSGKTLGPAQSCTVGVGFAPTDGGTQSATLVIPSNDPDQPTVTVTLSGTGRGPEIAAAPLALEFGSVQINTRSASQTVTVQNLGTRALAIGTITLGGAHADQFRKPALTDLCSGRTLASTQSCTVGVRFRPGTPGATSAKLVIPSKDFNEDPLKVTLRGSGRP